MNSRKLITLLVASSCCLALVGCYSPVVVSDHSTAEQLLSRWQDSEKRLGKPNQEFRDEFKDSLNEQVYLQGELDKTKILQ